MFRTRTSGGLPGPVANTNRAHLAVPLMVPRIAITITLKGIIYIIDNVRSLQQRLQKSSVMIQL
jgi:hypothetical protein